MKTLNLNLDSTITSAQQTTKARSCRFGFDRAALFCLALACLGVGNAVAQPAAPTPLPVIVADFNHDGIPDTLIQSRTTPTATIAFGSVPYGTFAANSTAVTLPGSCTFLPQGGMQVGDFNSDGIPDIAFACDSLIGVLPGKGDGTFGDAITIASNDANSTMLGNSRSLLVGDFNHDGKVDLVVLTSTIVTPSTSQTIFFVAGGGDGTFAQPVQSPLATGTYTVPVAADLNGDAFPDLAVINAPFDTNPSLDVLGNNQDGTFGTASQGSFASSASVSISNASASSILVGNFFGLVTTDLVVVGAGGNSDLFAFQNTSSATSFTFNDPVTIPVAALTGGKAGKFTGSGFTDVAVSNGTNITVLANDGKGNFAATYTTLKLVSTAAKFEVADANGDGYADIYTATLPSSGPLQLAVNLTSGSSTATSQPFSLPIGTAAITASWPGNVNFTGVTASGSQIVVGVPTTTTLTSSKNPSQLGDAVTFTVHVAGSAATLQLPRGNILLTDGTTLLTSDEPSEAGDLTFTTSTLTQGTHTITATFAGDTLYAASSATVAQVVNHPPAVAPTLSWATPAGITYGTAISATQLNALATDSTGATIPGVYAYTPAAGTLLDAGTRTLSVTFTPTDTLAFLAATRTVTIAVAKAPPVLTWVTPASIPYGTALGANQLNATATGVTGAALPGVFTYTPAAGTVPAPGTQALSVSFTPTNALDYTVATKSVNLIVTGVTVSSFTPNTATLGSTATTVVVTGAGFVANSVVQVNGTAIPTTLTNPTTLTAVIPASYFTTAGTLQITVLDPSVSSTSAPVTFTVTAPTPIAILNVPPTTQPGSQPTVTLSLSEPYPVDITATVTLSFAASTTPAVNDPNIVFADTGTTSENVTIPAGSVTVPPIKLQAGTVAGTITVPIKLTAGGADITPESLQPGVIVVPAAVPAISTVTATRSGKQLTVVMHGFSNTREMVNAKFHFTPAAGASLDTTDLTIPADAIFNTNWFQTTTSDQYGSTFTYTQIFNTSDDASTIGSVDVTLTNTIGASDMKTSQ